MIRSGGTAVQVLGAAVIAASEELRQVETQGGACAAMCGHGKASDQRVSDFRVSQRGVDLEQDGAQVHLAETHLGPFTGPVG